MIGIPPARSQSVDARQAMRFATSHDKYATERKGFWLNTSLSMKRFNKSQDIGKPGWSKIW
jgi:hypothetical protein